MKDPRHPITVQFDRDLLSPKATEFLRLLGIPEASTQIVARQFGTAPGIALVSTINRAERIRKFGYEGGQFGVPEPNRVNGKTERSPEEAEALEKRIATEIQVFEADKLYETHQWVLPATGVHTAQNDPAKGADWINAKAAEFHAFLEKGYFTPQKRDRGKPTLSESEGYAEDDKTGYVQLTLPQSVIDDLKAQPGGASAWVRRWHRRWVSQGRPPK